MPTAYEGNPAGGLLTSPVPGRTAVPAANIPADGDPDNAATFAAAFETAFDWLAYLQLGGALGDALGGGATSFDGPANPSAWNDMLTTVGAPISGLDVLPTFAAASGYAITVGAGSGFLYTSVGIHAGESAYRSIAWGAQNFTLANPHATNPRIDAITVTPATFGNPSVLAVVTGTPAVINPLPPAIPAGSAALFYVLVPPAAADSTAFRACRGLWRRVGYPWSGMTGIIAGAELSTNYLADPATTDAGLLVGAADQSGLGPSINRVLIDGEVIEWMGQAAFHFSDSTADPFASAASASFDRPYYIYACGGRHNPLPCPSLLSGSLNPVSICESTVPPNPKTGKPTANLTVNGVTVIPDGAVYLGLGFVVAGTTRRRGWVMDGEMTYGFNELGFLGLTVTATGKNDMGTFAGQCQPSISTKMLLSASFINGAANGCECGVFVGNFPTTVAGSGIRGYCGVGGSPGGAATMNYVPVSFTTALGAEIWAQLNSGNGTIQVYAMGFNHRVRRLISGL